MAYADKSSDMQRVVLSQGGHVIWEGVLIDDTILSICRVNDSILYKPIKEIMEWIEIENSNLLSEQQPYILLYKDNEEDKHWNVKSDYLLKLAGVRK